MGVLQRMFLAYSVPVAFHVLGWVRFSNYFFLFFAFDIFNLRTVYAVVVCSAATNSPKYRV